MFISSLPKEEDPREKQRQLDYFCDEQSKNSLACIVDQYQFNENDIQSLINIQNLIYILKSEPCGIKTQEKQIKLKYRNLKISLEKNLCHYKNQIIFSMVASFNQYLARLMEPASAQTEEKVTCSRINQVCFIIFLIKAILYMQYGNVFSNESASSIEGVEIQSYKEIFFQMVAESYVYDWSHKNAFQIESSLYKILEENLKFRRLPFV